MDHKIMNILIVGSSGQLGREFFAIKELHVNFNLSFVSRNDLDIALESNVELFLSSNRFDVIVNCAAYTDVENAEKNATIANITNANSIGYLCKSLEKSNPKTVFIHISTDYIFDGNSSIPINENDAPNPISKYGKSKFKGEQLLQASKIPSLILRVSWLYSPFGKNFLKTILELGKTQKTINVVNDQIGSPTSAHDLANIIMQIINSDKFFHFAYKKEIFNFSNSGSCNWYEFAKEILRLSDSKCLAIPVSSSEFSSSVKRPKYSVLNISKIKASFDLDINSWQYALRYNIRRIFTETHKKI
jgi:dTDP-4-dehydrorhamnose reductase